MTVKAPSIDSGAFSEKEWQTIRIPGEPVSQPRQRHAVIAGHLRNYTPAKAPVNAYKYAIRCEALNCFTGTPTNGPVGLSLTFVFSRPKAHYRTGKHSNEMRSDAPEWHTHKPDIENCAKAVMDALTGIVYKDDSQVAWLHITKKYHLDGDQAMTLIEIDTSN